jgi:hypothetical protein
MPSWWRWFRSRFAKRGEGMRVVVYTRANCPLCDKAADFLLAEQRRFGFSLRWVDIADDPDLTAQYGNWVPVVEMDGVVRFRGQINPVLWRRIMR